MTIRDDSIVTTEARADHDRALHFELRARATELAATLPPDAVERVLQAAADAAVADGLDAEASELSAALAAHRRARAALPSLDAERARRGGAT